VGLVLHPVPFSPRDLAQSVATSLAGRAEGKALKAAISIAKNLPARVRGDEVRLRSALENLIDNAVKFTEHGSVGFSASAKPAGRGRSRLTFIVRDSGIGIVATDLKRLFRPFAQASEDVARRYGGAGLGLLFVKRIATAMGGSLKVASKPGRGSTFTLTVAVENDAAPRRRPARPGEPPANLRVLSVEDNPYGRVVLGTVLRELGHRVTFVGTGEAAVEAARIRLRPILMTSLAFVLGVVPLVVASGAGEHGRHSVGTTVFGGMIVSTILNLFFIPVLYLIIEGWRERGKSEAVAPVAESK